jgi:peptidoglycan/xylan/chitin deacetylase (PgdA/CDA1 family)
MANLYFLYHELRPVRSRYSYVLGTDEFQSHCELFARLRTNPEHGWLVPEITFDDGNLSDIRLAMPLLARFGLKATFFVTAGWTGTRPGFMGVEELRELQAAGHTLGAHGLTHKLLTACSPDELTTELVTSRRLLEDRLERKVRVMSLPGGRANARVLRACSEAGYTRVFTSVPEPVDMEFNPGLVGRLNLHGDTTVTWLEQVLNPNTGVLERLSRQHKVKALAQRVLGDRLYASLWALGNGQKTEAKELKSV